jgi:DNA sulfur modification protein DndC
MDMSRRPSPRQASLFDDQRQNWTGAIEETAVSLRLYGAQFRHWAIAYSGGKDSTCLLTVVCHLLETGRVPRPESLTVLYADTRMELTPLHASAMATLEAVRARGIDTRIVLPEMDERFFGYMFGRGVPPPKNRFRWCTPQIKIEPMLRALQDLRTVAGEKFLMLTGVRLGESAQRDARIALSCSRDGAECGQGWFQTATPEAVADTLAPIVHWRICFVWDWLFLHAPSYGFPTRAVAEAYGGDEAEEINARTGCVGCNLASKDTALITILRNPKWAYLQPLMRLRPLYAELIKAPNRLRKDGSEKRKDGSLVSNPMRLGPLTMEAREMGLAEVLAIQAEIEAGRGEMPAVCLIDAEEEARIRELMALNTWPNGWSGDEVTGDVWLPETMPDGSVQDLLAGWEVGS